MTQVSRSTPRRGFVFWLRIAVALGLLAALAVRVPWRDRIELEAVDGRQRVVDVEMEQVDDGGGPFLIRSTDEGQLWTARVVPVRNFELEQIGVPAQLAADGWSDVHGRWTPGLLPQLARLDPWLFLAAFLLAGCGTVLASARWRLLLAAQGIQLPLGRVLRLNLSGLAASQVMLGSIGGDVVKMGLVARHSNEGPALSTLTHAALAIAVDRIVGLAALLTVGIAASVTFSDDPHGLLRWFGGALFALAIGLLALLWLAGTSRGLSGPSLIGRALHSISTAVAAYRGRPGLLAAGFLLSLGSHSALILCVATLGVALDLPVTGMRYFQILPVVETLQALPVSPAGWGVAESSYVVLLGDLGVPAAQALSLAMCVRAVTLCQAAIGVPLLLTLIRGAREAPRTPVDASATAV